MKNLFTALTAICALTIASAPLSGQSFGQKLLDAAKKKAEEKITKKVEKRTEEAIDKAGKSLDPKRDDKDKNAAGNNNAEGNNQAGATGGAGGNDAGAAASAKGGTSLEMDTPNRTSWLAMRLFLKTLLPVNRWASFRQCGIW